MSKSREHDLFTHLQGYGHLDLGTFSRFRLQVEFTVEELSAFAHAQKTQSFAVDLLRSKTDAAVSNRQGRPAVADSETNRNLFRLSMFGHVS